MANRILNQIYTQLYDESFSYTEFSKRLKMQKGIYLLQEMGVPVGDYRFSWYKHGPYSQELLDDMHNMSLSNRCVLAEEARIAVSDLHNALVVPATSNYSQEDWSECLGSLHYLKENIFALSSNDSELLGELIKRKPHLDDIKSNEIALQRIEKLFA